MAHTLIFVLLEAHWPPLTRKSIGDYNLGDRRIEVAALPDGRLEAVLESEVSGPQETKSCKIIAGHREGAHLIVTVAIDDSWVVDWRINGRTAHFRDPDITSAGRPERKSVKIDLTVDQEGIKKAVQERRTDFERELSSQKLDDTGPVIRRMWNSLERLIAALPLRIKRAKEDWSVDLGPLAVDLRTLCTRTRGGNLLRLCAADINSEIEVWTRPPLPSHLWTPEVFFEGKETGDPNEGLSISFETFELRPQSPQTHLTDFDCWLLHGTGWLVDRRLTPELIIKEIADKLGAHSDLHDVKRIDALTQNKYADTVIALNLIVPLAERVEKIGQNLLRERLSV